MNNREAIKVFKEAKRLYKTGRYQEALDRLANLNGHFPGNFNILYPMLMCHEKLGHNTDARDLCVKILPQFLNPKERVKLLGIYERLSKQENVQTEDDIRLDTMVAEPASKRVTVLPDSAGIIQIAGYWIAWQRLLPALVIIGAAITGLLVIPLVIGDINPRSGTNGEVLFLALAALHFYLWNCFACYAALWASNNLVHDDLLGNILDAFFFAPFLLFLLTDRYSLIWTDLSITDQYNMSFGESVAFFLTFILFNAAYIYFLWGSGVGKEVWELFF